MKILGCIVAALLVSSAPAFAQWLKYPTAGIPRTPDGKADPSAPTPRHADGRPVLSGLWRPAPGGPGVGDIARNLEEPVPFQPWAEALYKERRANNSRDDPTARCVVGGVPRSDLVGYPYKIVEVPGMVVILYEAVHGYRQIEQLRVTERFVRKSFGQMDIEITIDDPKAYTKPWTVTQPLAYQADTLIQPRPHTVAPALRSISTTC